MALLWAHQYDTPPALTVSRPDLPAAVDAVFAKALAKSPDDRYDSCLAFVTALRAAASGHRATEADVRAAPSAGPPAPPRWARPVFRER